MKAYWWKDVNNFGDRLTPYLLTHFSGVTPVWAPIDQADLIATGSIIHHVQNSWGGVILGSGLLRKDLPVHVSDANILAVRGPLTRAAVVGHRNHIAQGDPGLLANELVNVRTKRWELGVLPHWSDDGLAYRASSEFAKYKPKLIDPTADPLTVVRQIGQCRKLVTSSLHGVIVADSFGIPRRIETTNLFELDTMFKFDDYHKSINHEYVIGKTSKPHRGHVEARKHAIYDAFRRLAS